MSLSICADCLSRLRISSKTSAPLAMAATTTLIQASSFHSSAAQFKSNLVKKSSVMSVKAKGGQSRKSQSARLKKKARVRPKLPPIGERKAQRHRIVLSNVNAIPLSDMETWSKGNMLEDKNVGQVLGLEPELLDQLRASKAFKTTQNWNLFRKPATLIRSQTVKIAQEMEAVNNAGDAKTLRHLMTGDRASGKSVLLLQAMCMAYMNKWVVINVPEGKFLVSDLLLNGVSNLWQPRISSITHPPTLLSDKSKTRPPDLNSYTFNRT